MGEGGGCAQKCIRGSHHTLSCLDVPGDDPHDATAQNEEADVQEPPSLVLNEEDRHADTADHCYQSQQTVNSRQVVIECAIAYQRMSSDRPNNAADHDHHQYNLGAKLELKFFCH